MHTCSLTLLLLSSSLLLTLLPSVQSSPGHYVHTYYREGTYNGRAQNRLEQGRSPRHLNHKNSVEQVNIMDRMLVTMLMLVATVRHLYA